MATWKRGWSTIFDWRRPSLAVTCAGMSRHQMTVMVATGSCPPLLDDVEDRRRRPAGRDGGDRRAELAVAGLAPLVAEAQPASCSPRDSVQCGVDALREVYEPLVVAEVLLEELWMPVDAKALHDHPVEVPGEEVGQEERPRLVLDDLRELRRGGIELVAMGAGETLDALLGDHGIEQ